MGQALGGDSLSPSVSTEGRFVAFHSSVTNLVPGDTNGTTDVFVHDRTTSITTRASVGPAGAEATGPSANASLSADGRYVAFESTAPDLVANDTNGISDVFVRDRATGLTTRVSVSSGGGQATSGSTSGSYTPAISPDGRLVVFDSFATNLVAGDTNGQRDVFLHDRATGQTSRVSVATGGGQATGGASYSPAVSADGRYVVFVSEAANVIAGDTNAAADVFVRDTRAFQRARVSVSSNGGEANGRSIDPSLSADGRYVAFQSASADEVLDVKRRVWVAKYTRVDADFHGVAEGPQRRLYPARCSWLDTRGPLLRASPGHCSQLRRQHRGLVRCLLHSVESVSPFFEVQPVVDGGYRAAGRGTVRGHERLRRDDKRVRSGGSRGECRRCRARPGARHSRGWGATAARHLRDLPRGARMFDPEDAEPVGAPVQHAAPRFDWATSRSGTRSDPASHQLLDVAYLDRHERRQVAHDQYVLEAYADVLVLDLHGRLSVNVPLETLG